MKIHDIMLRTFEKLATEGIKEIGRLENTKTLKQ